MYPCVGTRFQRCIIHRQIPINRHNKPKHIQDPLSPSLEKPPTGIRKVLCLKRSTTSLQKLLLLQWGTLLKSVHNKRRRTRERVKSA